jgi:hypothetical protein
LPFGKIRKAAISYESNNGRRQQVEEFRKKHYLPSMVLVRSRKIDGFWFVKTTAEVIPNNNHSYN